MAFVELPGDVPADQLLDPMEELLTGVRPTAFGDRGARLRLVL